MGYPVADPRQILLGALLAILISYNACLTLGFGMMGASGSSIVTGTLLFGLPLVIFSLAFRQGSLKIQPADFAFVGLLGVALFSFSANPSSPDSGKEYLLLISTVAAYVACRPISISDIGPAKSGFEIATGVIVFFGAIFTAAEIARQWNGLPLKPFVFGFVGAGTYFSIALSFLIIALVTTDEPTPRRTALVSILIFIPTAVFAAAMVRFTFIALICSLIFAAITTKAGKRWHVTVIALTVLAGVALGLASRYSTTMVYAAYVLEVPAELEASLTAPGASSLVMPSCNLEVNMRNSIAIRQALIRDAIYLIPFAGLVGTGLDSFMNYSCIKAHQVHVSILQMTVEFGWLGGILFFILIGLAIFTIVPSAKHDEGFRFVACSLAFSVMMTMAHGRVSRDVPLFCILGCAVAIGSQRRLSSESKDLIRMERLCLEQSALCSSIEARDSLVELAGNYHSNDLHPV